MTRLPDESLTERILELQAETFHAGMEAGIRRMARKACTPAYMQSDLLREIDAEFGRRCEHEQHGYVDGRCARCGAADPLAKKRQ